MGFDGLKKLFWFIPVFLTLHNIEEALTMPKWISLNVSLLRNTLWIFEYIHFSPTQLYVSLISVTLFPLVLVVYCQQGNLSQRKILIMLTLQSVIFWNALIPHISGLYVLEMYNPGVVTATMCNIPITIYLFMKVKKEASVSHKRVLMIFAIGILGYFPLVYINHMLAQSVSHYL